MSHTVRACPAASACNTDVPDDLVDIHPRIQHPGSAKALRLRSALPGTKPTGTSALPGTKPTGTSALPGTKPSSALSGARKTGTSALPGKKPTGTSALPDSPLSRSFLPNGVEKHATQTLPGTCAHPAGRGMHRKAEVHGRGTEPQRQPDEATAVATAGVQLPASRCSPVVRRETSATRAPWWACRFGGAPQTATAEVPPPPRPPRGGCFPRPLSASVAGHPRR